MVCFSARLARVFLAGAGFAAAAFLRGTRLAPAAASGRMCVPALPVIAASTSVSEAIAASQPAAANLDRVQTAPHQ
jgi:hypothetical protein